jgi:PKD repeat protein
MADYTYGIGQELQFNTIGTDLTHTWDFGDGSTISSDPIPTHTYTLPGTYTVTHGARDFCGACTSIIHTVDIIQASITVRSILLSKYTAKVGDIVTVTVIAQNLSPIFGTGTIVIRFDSDVIGTFNATLDPNQEVSFDISRQVTTAGTINVCADNVCTVLFVESQVTVQSITLDTNISTGNPIIATIGVQNTGTFTEDKTIQTTLTNNTTAVIDERVVTAPPGTMSYQVPVTIIGLPNGVYTLCAETICKALSVAIPTETTGRLSISSTPTGAAIFVDGQSTAQSTNATIINILPGDHTFTLNLSGYNSTTGTFNIIAGMTTYVYSALSIADPITGGISISSAPPGAEIWIDDVQQLDINNQPLTTPATVTNLSPISYDITLKLPGYIDYNKTIDIIAGQTTYLSVALMQAPILIGSVNFTTVPDGARIFIDDQEQLGKFTPTTITDIPIGSHTFILKYPGRNDVTGGITVIGGTTSYVYVGMTIVSPTKGSISISSIPQDADIYIDDVLYSTKTPATIDDLTPNVYTIVLKKKGYNDYTTMINAIAGQTISINITLVPKVMIVGLEFPWWLVLGLGLGMFQMGKFKELKEIKGIVASGAHPQLTNKKGKVVTLTKRDYTIT